MLGKGFGDVGEAKGSSTTGSQFLEQFKTAQALAQLAAQHSQPAGSTSAASWDMGSSTQTSSLVQYGKEKQPGSPTTVEAVNVIVCELIELLLLYLEQLSVSFQTVSGPGIWCS